MACKSKDGEKMNPETISLGQYSLPFILSIILGLIFKRSNISNDLKPYIAVLCGIGLGIAGMFYNIPGAHSFQMWADYMMAGGIAGAAATGIYEMSKGALGKSVYVPVDSENKKIPGARVVKIKSPKILK
jgi:Phage holin family Hol44, in holin superfamily V